jgi:hypothetical protein
MSPEEIRQNLSAYFPGSDVCGFVLTGFDSDYAHDLECPAHDWGDKTGWRLFNSATYVLTGRVAERSSATADLHRSCLAFDL